MAAARQNEDIIRLFREFKGSACLQGGSEVGGPYLAHLYGVFIGEDKKISQEAGSEEDG